MKTTANTSRPTAEQTATTIIDTPIGPITLIASDRGLRAVMWPGEEPGRVKLEGVGGADDPIGSTPPTAILETAADQLAEYFDGERTDVRRAARSDRHRVPTGRVDRAAHDPVRRDDQLRRAGGAPR